MSYKISVPVINENAQRNGLENIEADLRRLNAERVFLALDCYEFDEEKRKEALKTLRENCKFFHSKGFEVGAWIWAFMFKETISYHRITALNLSGEVTNNEACPLDEDFLDFSGKYISEIAACGVDMIMFDDDLRFGFLGHGNMGCLCELHREMICERIGEELSHGELVQRILSGGKNKYRDAWLECNGYSLEKFAANARKYVDTVDPKIRMGYCSCLSGWDVDGTEPDRLCRILAGNTKPFVRLIGAPYWGAGESWGNKLQHVIELERMEHSWMDDGEIEIFAEGDTYPRPRIKTPASYLEGFDTAVRASGCTDGILKYAIDYTSSTSYERGYINFHEHNRELYKAIDRSFGDKKCCGIRIYEFQKKVENADLSLFPEPHKATQYFYFSYAARFLSCQAIPTVYEGDGVCGIAFGENARYLNGAQRKGGLIIDGSAAKILHERGVDVGIAKLGEKQRTVTEYFEESGELISTFGAEAYGNQFNSGIKVLSYGRQSGGFSLMGKNVGEAAVPLSYLYENGNGERYLVLNIDANNCLNTNARDLLNQQMRGRQIADNVEWLSRGGRLPAYCYGNPYLYMIAKEADGKLTVGLWNFFADPVFEPVVEVAEGYSAIKLLNGVKGEICGDTVRLGEIPAFGFAAFELTK